MRGMLVNACCKGAGAPALPGTAQRLAGGGSHWRARSCARAAGCAQGTNTQLRVVREGKSCTAQAVWGSPLTIAYKRRTNCGV